MSKTDPKMNFRKLCILFMLLKDLSCDKLSLFFSFFFIFQNTTSFFTQSIVVSLPSALHRLVARPVPAGLHRPVCDETEECDEQAHQSQPKQEKECYLMEIKPLTMSWALVLGMAPPSALLRVRLPTAVHKGFPFRLAVVVCVQTTK